MPTRRERQVKQAMTTRTRQIVDLRRDELHRLVGGRDVRWRSWGGRGQQPTFCYSTTPVETPTGERGFVSWVLAPSSVVSIRPSYELHKTRKAAKARAFNLWQGWRLSAGLSPQWGTFA